MTEKEIIDSDKTNTKPKDEKSQTRKRESKKNQKSGEKYRVIVRRLPPTMTKEEFLEQISPLPNYSAFYFAPPDWSLGAMASARAYFTFLNPDEIFVFRDKYDGYVFVDVKGNEYSAVVEFAPFQGFTKSRCKERFDKKEGTIEKDTHYISYLESLKNIEQENKNDTKMEYTYQLKEDVEIKTTPLLEFLESKKTEKIAERKRKTEEKKKKRVEERQTRKIKESKKIPPTIKEEPSEQSGNKDASKKPEKETRSKQQTTTSNIVAPDDDGIMVRVVPSRLSGNQRNNNNNKKKDEERHRDRNRNKSRRDRKESSEHDEKKKESSKMENVSSNTNKEKRQDPVKLKKDEPETTSKDPAKKSEEKSLTKREVKKYSERRKEIRDRAENRRNETIMPQSSESLNVSAQPFVPNFKKSVETDDGKTKTTSASSASNDQKNSDKKEVNSENSANENEKAKASKKDDIKRREERIASNLKNKDRPSIEIYQPRRVRIAANFNGSEDDSKSKKGKESEKSHENEKSRERVRRSSCHDKPSSSKKKYDDESHGVSN